MTIKGLYDTIAKALLGENPSEEDALSVMILLHTHHLQLPGAVLRDRPRISDLAITQRHAAEVIADAWPNREDRNRTSREHWYFAFNTRSPFEVIDDIPPEWMSRVERARTKLINSGFVTCCEPED